MWAHQHAFSSREAYRAVELMNWFFEHLNHKVEELENIRKLFLQSMCLEVFFFL